MTESTSFLRKSSIKLNHKFYSPTANVTKSKKTHPFKFINYPKLAYFPRRFSPHLLTPPIY